MLSFHQLEIRIHYTVRMAMSLSLRQFVGVVTSVPCSGSICFWTSRIRNSDPSVNKQKIKLIFSSTLL
jgi:hypothetical protein